jgi:ribosomal protein S18 acetylase RimI-like enzyme
MDFIIRANLPSDRAWMAAFIDTRWGSSQVIVHGVAYEPHRLDGFLAEAGGNAVALATYIIQDGDCEVVTLDSTLERAGIGTALMAAVEVRARAQACRRVWLTTTNDNIDALAFYQKRGYVLRELRRDAVKESRRVKPEIPLVGAHGIPLRDEIDLEKDFISTLDVHGGHV